MKTMSPAEDTVACRRNISLWSRRDSIKAALSCEAQTMPGDSMQVMAMLHTETIFHTVILLIKIYGKQSKAEGEVYWQ